MKKHKLIIFNVSGGLGKNIIATAVTGALKRQHPESHIVVTTPHGAAWQNNPDISEIIDLEKTPFFYRDFIAPTDAVIHMLEPYHSGDYFYGRKSLAAVWANLCGVSAKQLTPVLYPTDAEINSAKTILRSTGADSKIFLIQTSGGAPNQPFPISWARDLPLPIADEICLHMKKEGYRPIHLRRPDQKPLGHAEWLNMSLREAFALISLSDKRLFIDSFAQHAAAALEKPAVVTWVSNDPVVFGHKLHTNIVPNIETKFRHKIDSFMESHNITGSLHEYPYDTDKIYNTEEIMDALFKE